MEPVPEGDILRAMSRSRFGLVLLLAALTGCMPTYSRRQGAAAKARPEAVAAESSAPRSVTPSWRTIAYSVKGRPLQTATFGRGARRVLWIGGIHGDEREGRVATAELPAALAAVPGAFDRVTLTILEDANPDGSAANTRGNANGVDLNRNYPAKNFKPLRAYGISPLSQPESRAVHELISKGRFDLVIVAHSWRNDHFINFDGPGQGAAELFSRLSGYPVRDSGDMTPTPGSLGSWCGRTLGVPILTLEYHRGRDAWDAWKETKNAILGVIVDGARDASAPATDEDDEAIEAGERR